MSTGRFHCDGRVDTLEWVERVGVSVSICQERLWEAAETQRFSLGGNFLQRGTNESEAPGSVHTNTASTCKSTLRMLGLQWIAESQTQGKHAEETTRFPEIVDFLETSH